MPGFLSYQHAAVYVYGMPDDLKLGLRNSGSVFILGRTRSEPSRQSLPPTETFVT